MKTMVLLSALFIAGCGTGEKAVEGTGSGEGTGRGVTTLLAGDPEGLRTTVMGLIGEGRDAEAALEIIDRYEADLGFVLGERSSGATIADSAAASEAPLYSGIGPPWPRRDEGLATGRQTGDISDVRIRRFVRNSLSVAMIGINECYDNFAESGDDRFARRGLAHGYIALISDPSHAQKSNVLEMMKILQERLMR